MTGFEDITKGFHFVATMNQSVPLWILEKHGETHPGPPSELPEYGGQQHGIWLPVLKSWEELGVQARELEGATMASAVGQIPRDGGDFLPFLKKFRRIVESAEEVSVQIKRMDALATSNPTYARFAEKLGPNLPRRWFSRRLLEELPSGVGAKTAERLYDAGLRTVAEVRAASDQDLLAVSGVGQGTIKKLRDHLARGS